MNQTISDKIKHMCRHMPKKHFFFVQKKNLYVPIIYSFFSIIDDHARMIFKP